MQEGIGCTNRTRPVNITHENGFYQVLQTSNGTFRMLSAFYDARQMKKNWPVIHVIALINVVKPTVQTFCQLWFDDIEAPIISHVHRYRYLFYEAWGYSKDGPNEYRLACSNPLASIGKIPKSVSIVEKPCDNATNLLKISYNLPKNNVKDPIAICTKPFIFDEDISMILIEWVEAWFALGISKICLNVMKVHPKLKETLKFYEFKGKMEVRMFSLPIERQRSGPNEMIALNDCLLRNMYKYKFLLAVDIDEIIVPSTNKDKNLVEFIDRMIEKFNIKDKTPKENVLDGYAAANSFFFLDNNHQYEIQPEVPKHFHFLQKIFRSVRYPGVGPKSFQNTETTDVMHNHYPLYCVKDQGDGCRVGTFELEDAKLHHYRRTCSLVASALSVDQCNDFTTNTTRDDSLWFWKDAIIVNVFKTLDELETYRIEVGLAQTGKFSESSLLNSDQAPVSLNMNLKVTPS